MLQGRQKVQTAEPCQNASLVLRPSGVRLRCHLLTSAKGIRYRGLGTYLVDGRSAYIRAIFETLHYTDANFGLSPRQEGYRGPFMMLTKPSLNMGNMCVQKSSRSHYELTQESAISPAPLISRGGKRGGLTFVWA